MFEFVIFDFDLEMFLFIKELKELEFKVMLEVFFFLELVRD